MIKLSQDLNSSYHTILARKGAFLPEKNRPKMEERAMNPIVSIRSYIAALSPPPALKRFGLRQAKIAADIAKMTTREFGKSPSVVKVTTKAMRAFALVLGYEDTMRPELEKLAAVTATKNEILQEEITRNLTKIDNLNAEIGGLEGENEQLALDTIANNQYLTEVQADVALFA